jgi:hypothetical protein
MQVPMMLIRIVWMAVPQRLMRVRMRMRLRTVIFRIVVMLMMNIVHVPVIVGHPCMNMLMIVTFAQVQPQAGSHQHTCADQLDRQTTNKTRLTP